MGGRRRSAFFGIFLSAGIEGCTSRLRCCSRPRVDSCGAHMPEAASPSALEMLPANMKAALVRPSTAETSKKTIRGASRPLQARRQTMPSPHWTATLMAG